MGAERDQLASVVSSVVNVRSPGDIMTLTAVVATDLRGAATLKARAVKDTRNIPAVPRTEKGTNSTGTGSSLNGSLVTSLFLKKIFLEYVAENYWQEVVCSSKTHVKAIFTGK